MVSARRNENSKLWRKYTIRRAEMQAEKRLSEEHTKAAAELPPYACFTNVETTMVWSTLFGDVGLESDINEWFLFHGTSAAAADKICQNDFKYSLAGSAT